MAEVPEFYVDQIRVAVTPYTVSLVLSVSSPIPASGDQPRDVAVVRMGPHMAKVIAMLLRRQLKKYEEDSGTPISVPPGVLNSMGLSLEDW